MTYTNSLILSSFVFLIAGCSTASEPSTQNNGQPSSHFQQKIDNKVDRAVDRATDKTLNKTSNKIEGKIDQVINRLF